MKSYNPRNQTPARADLTDPRSSAPARGGPPKPLNDRRSTRSDPRST
jgi:hypothetical protein